MPENIKLAIALLCLTCRSLLAIVYISFLFILSNSIIAMLECASLYSKSAFNKSFKSVSQRESSTLCVCNMVQSTFGIDNVIHVKKGTFAWQVPLFSNT